MQPVRHIVLAVVASMLLVACASQTNKGAGGGPGQPGKVTASGYTQEGCLLNLKIAAREKNVRLIPSDIQVESRFLMLLFPFLNDEGYRCSGSFTEREKRPLSKDPLYPFE